MAANALGQRAVVLPRLRLRSRSIGLTQAGVLLVGGVAAVPRLWNLTVQDPFIDEATWLHWAIYHFKILNPDTYWMPIQIALRPPLYYWTIALTGRLSDNAIVGGRLAAAVPDVLTAIGVYVLGRVLFSPRVGVVAGLLWALNPFPVFFARIASDDGLMTCFAVWATVAAIDVARRPTPKGGLLLGLLLGLTVLTKTLGLITIGWAAMAFLVFGSRERIAQLARAGALAIVALAVVLLPLVPWIGQLMHGADVYVGRGGSTPTASVGLEKLLQLERFSQNAIDAYNWLAPVLGYVIPLLATLSLVVAGRRFSRAHLFLGAVWILTVLVVLDRAQILFSRYFLLLTVPAFVLAAELLARVTAWLGRSPRAVALSVAGVTAVAVAPMLPLLIDVDTRPAEAAISAPDHYQYFEQWYALNGLGTVTDYLHDQARLSGRPVTVLVPPTADRNQATLPASMLLAWLRRDPQVQFLEEPSLRDALSLCDLRSWMTRGPTFTVVNGAYALGIGDESQVPGLTRRLEAGFARDVPTAREVLRLDRRTVPAWLSVYRVDSAASVTGRCYDPRHDFDQNWRNVGLAPDTDDQLRSPAGRAGYAEGPLPAGRYKPLIWARTLRPDTTVRLVADDGDLGFARPIEPGGQGWQWLAPDTSTAVDEGGRVRLQFDVTTTSPGEGDALVVRQLVLQREP